MELIIINNNDLGQNVYIYFDPATKEGVIIDPGNNPEDIMEAINQNNIKVKAILLTHGHFDHISSVEEIKEQTEALVYCHEQEKQFLEDSSLNLSGMRRVKEVKFSPDGLLGDNIFCFKVIHTPGHTPGCVCYYDEENGIIFTGDTLFKNAVGRTDLPLSDHGALVKAVKEKLFSLPDDTVVYPGHGESTSIGGEKG